MAYFVQSNEWDIRFNINENYSLESILHFADLYWTTDTLKYLHVSGVELGTREQDQTDGEGLSSFKKEHVHVALITKNPVYKTSVLSAFHVNGSNCEGYYCEPRDKGLPYRGWLNYHTKSATKINGKDLLFVKGKLPMEGPSKRQPKGHEESMIVNKQLLEEQDKQNKLLAKHRSLRKLMRKRDYDTMDLVQPGFQYSKAGKKMKASVQATLHDHHNKPLLKRNNFIVWGDSGTGKSSSIEHLYPNCYHRGNNSVYWEDYDVECKDDNVVHVEEVGAGQCSAKNYHMLKKMSYLTSFKVNSKDIPKFWIRPKMIIATMNVNPMLLCEGIAVRETLLLKHFKIIHISKWLEMHGLILTEKGVREQIDYESLSDGDSSTSTMSIGSSTEDGEEVEL